MVTVEWRIRQDKSVDHWSTLLWPTRDQESCGAPQKATNINTKLSIQPICLQINEEIQKKRGISLHCSVLLDCM